MSRAAAKIALGSMRSTATLLALVLTSCGVAPPSHFDGGAIAFVLPVSELPSGSRVTTERGLDATDLELWLAAGRPGTVEADMKQDQLSSAYLRSFRVVTETTAFSAECIVLMFAEPVGAQATVSKRRDAWVTYGYHPISLAQKLGDRSSAISLDGVTPGKNGGPDIPTTVVRVLVSVANAAFIVSIQDDPKDINPLDAVFVANKQVDFLMSPRGSP